MKRNRNLPRTGSALIVVGCILALCSCAGRPDSADNAADMQTSGQSSQMSEQQQTSEQQTPEQQTQTGQTQDSEEYGTAGEKEEDHRRGIHPGV